METILNSGLFWGALCAVFVAILGIYSTRDEKKHTPAHN
jgi:hypothetical protein